MTDRGPDDDDPPDLVEERYTTLALRLRNLRTSYGLTNDQMAALLNVTPSTIHAWTKTKASKSAIEPPLMAIELLEYKLGVRRSPDRDATRILNKE